MAGADRRPDPAADGPGVSLCPGIGHNVMKQGKKAEAGQLGTRFTASPGVHGTWLAEQLRMMMIPRSLTEDAVSLTALVVGMGAQGPSC